jgi:hypothetical protein
MKISLDPLKQFKQEAESRVEGYFNRLASSSVQKTQEHELKRREAQNVLDGKLSGLLEAEALFTNTTSAELAAVILSKPNEAAERALQRRKAILGIRHATTRAEIDYWLAELNLPRLDEVL